MAIQKDKNEMTAKELYNEAKALYDAGKYHEVIALLDDVLLDKYKHAPLFNIRGMAYGNTKDFDSAFKDYDKAIRLKPDYAEAYNNRGITWGNKGEYDKAFADYDEAIRISPRKANVYYNRGNAWKNKGEYDKAIADYNEAIRLKDDYAGIYNNRGIAWDSKGEYDKAIADYNETIRLLPEHPFAYNNRGFSKEKKGEYENALADFEKAITLDPNYINAKNNRDRVKALLGQQLAIDEDSLSSIQLFVRMLAATQINEGVQKTILQLCAETLKNAIDKIRAHAGSNITSVVTNTEVAHYTKLNVADIIATNKDADSKLRYYNAVYMNDPEEGIVLLSCMDDDVQQCYANAAKQEEDNIYIGSFLPASRHEDELVMWRTYGKDTNGNEGAGCSIVINTGFFDTYDAKDGYINTQMTAKDNATIQDATPQCLYRVLYYNKHHDGKDIKKFNCSTGDDIANDVTALNDCLKKLIDVKNEHANDNEIAEMIDKVIYHLLSEVRYFFKSADYEFENEVRVIQFVPKNNKLLHIDAASNPKRVYIESNNVIQPFIEKIILGPKVPNPKQWMYLDVALRQNNPSRSKPVDVSISECKYQ